MKRVCILGLGYIGLPKACLLSKSYNVLGVDTNKELVSNINNNQIHTTEPGLKELLTEALESKRFTAKTQVEKADVFVIAVPTPLNAENAAELKYVKSAAEMITPLLRKGNLVILESTVPPKTSRHFVIPILEKSGLMAGKDFYFAYCSERAFPGDTLNEMINNSKIIGGINKKSAEMARELYSSFIKGEIFITKDVVAESVKLMENIYRDVNIALANELAKIAKDLGINILEAIELANKHPRVKILRPGPGVGGHCIPIDPRFLITKDSKLLKTAREINDTMPGHIISLLKEIIKTNNVHVSTVGILGAAYKANVNDARETPTLKLIELAKKQGWNVKVTDPYVKKFIHPLVTLGETLNSDIIIIATDHDEYKNLSIDMLKNLQSKIIFDTRNCIKPNTKTKLEQAGFKIFTLGNHK